MAIKVVERCKGCENDCKVQVDESLIDNLVLLQCPFGKKYKKKTTKNK